MRHRTVASLALLCAAALAAQPALARGESAVAELRNQAGHVVGSVKLTQQGNDVVLKGKVRGLPAGEHAFHIHEKGQCEAPFTSAGGHYNPHKKEHGHDNPHGAHVGDLRNIQVKNEGYAVFEQTLPATRLFAKEGPAILDQDGASVVIHEKADDYKTDPAGNAGARLVCGVIEMK